jgi:type VI secretion system secreted protein Hcp
MYRVIAFIVFILSFAYAASAEPLPAAGKAQSEMTIKIAGLNCTTSASSNTFNVLSYSFGATQETSSSSGGGGGAGKAVVSQLNAAKNFDECSPALFGAVVSGRHFPTADLVQQDDKGHPILTINLTDVLISSYQIGGSQASDNPQETIALSYSKICITEASSNTKMCYDRVANTVN